MAAFVLAGRANCKYFLKAERLADYLTRSLPNFKVEKQTIAPEQWKDWLANETSARGWTHTTSPLIWRALGYGNPKGLYVGGFTDFAALAEEVRGDEIQAIANENTRLAALKPTKETKQDVVVCVVGASCPAAYHALVAMLHHHVFGTHTNVIINLIDLPATFQTLSGLAMELEDLCSGCLSSISIHHSVVGGLRHAHVILVLDNNQDLDANVAFMKEFNAAIATSSPDVLIVLEGARANVNADLILALNPSLAAGQVTTVCGRVAAVAKNQIIQKVNKDTPKDFHATPGDVRGVGVFGCHGDEIINLSNAQIGNVGGVFGPPVTSPAIGVLDDSLFVAELSALTRARIVQLNKSPNHGTLTIANSVVEHLKALIHGTQSNDDVVSMGVSAMSNPYGVPTHVVAYFPVHIIDRQPTIVPGFVFSEEAKSACIDATKRLEAQATTLFAAFAIEHLTDVPKVTVAPPVEDLEAANAKSGTPAAGTHAVDTMPVIEEEEEDGEAASAQQAHL